MNYIIQFIRGFCMALADSVPGVSGGTIAFLLGFYDKFINSLNNLMGKDKEKRKEAILFLLKLVIGWVVGFILSVLVLANIFDSQIYKISSLFLGFIIFAIPIVIKDEKLNLKNKYKNIIFTVLGIAIVVIISIVNPASDEGINVSARKFKFRVNNLCIFSCDGCYICNGITRNIWFYIIINIWFIYTNNVCYKRILTFKFFVFSNISSIRTWNNYRGCNYN